VETRADIYKKTFAEQNHSEIISINNLRDKEFCGESLTEEEQQAIKNFDRFRFAELSRIETSSEFNSRYNELQAMANLTDYREFLKEEYFFSELL
jgi:hypothetical protein